jgi:serine/threonine protein kinase
MPLEECTYFPKHYHPFNSDYLILGFLTHREYLHSKNLIHRDLKAANLLVNNQGVCKVADFGISTVKPNVTRTMTCVGTPIYMAPEVLTRNKYSEKADVYSFGIVLLELFTGRLAYSEPEFAAMHIAQLTYQIAHVGVRPSVDGIHPMVRQLIVDCWHEDPAFRPSFSEIVTRLNRISKMKMEVLFHSKDYEPMSSLRDLSQIRDRQSLLASDEFEIRVSSTKSHYGVPSSSASFDYSRYSTK